MPEGMGYPNNALPGRMEAPTAGQTQGPQFAPFHDFLMKNYQSMSEQEKQLIRQIAGHPQLGPVVAKLMGPEFANAMKMLQAGAQAQQMQQQPQMQRPAGPPPPPVPQRPAMQQQAPQQQRPAPPPPRR